MSTEKITLTITGILEDLQNGYTRTSSDKLYQGDGKSIEEKYGLSKTEVKQVFLHEKLRGKKTILPKEESFILIDDTDGNNETTANASQTSTSINDEAAAKSTPADESSNVPVEADTEWETLS